MHAINFVAFHEYSWILYGVISAFEAISILNYYVQADMSLLKYLKHFPTISINGNFTIVMKLYNVDTYHNKYPLFLGFRNIQSMIKTNLTPA